MIGIEMKHASGSSLSISASEGTKYACIDDAVDTPCLKHGKRPMIIELGLHVVTLASSRISHFART